MDKKIILRGEDKHLVRICYTYLLIENILLNITKDYDFVKEYTDIIFNEIMEDNLILNLIYNSTFNLNNSVKSRALYITGKYITAESLYKNILNVLNVKEYMSFNDFKQLSDLYLIISSLLEKENINKYLDVKNITFNDISKYKYNIKNIDDLINGNEYDKTIYNEIIEYTNKFNLNLKKDLTLTLHKYFLLSKFNSIFSFNLTDEEHRKVDFFHTTNVEYVKNPKLYYVIPNLNSICNPIEHYRLGNILNNNEYRVLSIINITVGDEIILSRVGNGYQYKSKDSIYMLDSAISKDLIHYFKIMYQLKINNEAKNNIVNDKLTNYLINVLTSRYPNLMLGEPEVTIYDKSIETIYNIYNKYNDKLRHILKIEIVKSKNEKTVNLTISTNSLNFKIKDEDLAIQYIDNTIRLIVNNLRQMDDYFKTMEFALSNN